MGENGKRDERKNIILQIKNKKGGGESLKKKQKITRNTETRYWRDKVLGNAENNDKNENEVFLNVRKQRFESKNKVSSHP